jgi:hypothetical protein
MYPRQYSFDILTTVKPILNLDISNSVDGNTAFITHAIVYTGGSYRNWQVAKTGSVMPYVSSSLTGKSHCHYSRFVC